MSEQVTVVEALSAVMEDVQSVGKGERNTQQNYAFRGVDAVVNAVGPALRRHGVVVVPTGARYEAEKYNTAKGALMRGVTITVNFRFYGPAGDFIDAEVCGESSDAGDKAVPKAHSVAYRTLLLEALCIPTNEPDPDHEVHTRVRETTRIVETDAQKQTLDELREELVPLAVTMGADEADLRDKIAMHRSNGNPDGHEAWLRKSIAAAEKAAGSGEPVAAHPGPSEQAAAAPQTTGSGPDTSAGETSTRAPDPADAVEVPTPAEQNPSASVATAAGSGMLDSASSGGEGLAQADASVPRAAIPEHAAPFLLDHETRKALIEKVGQPIVGVAIVDWDKIRNAGTLANRVREMENADLLRLLGDHEARSGKPRKVLLGVIEGRLGILADVAAKAQAERERAALDIEPEAWTRRDDGATEFNVVAQAARYENPEVTAEDVANFGLALGVAAQTGGGAALDVDGGSKAPPETPEVGASPSPAARSPFQPPTTAVTTPLLRLKALVAFSLSQPTAFPESMMRNAHGVTGWILDGVRQSGWGNFATLDALAIDDADCNAVWMAVPADIRGHLESLSPADVAALAETLS